MAKAKRGRPPQGLPWSETGTAELQRKKAELTRGGNPQLSVEPLGVLLARELIDGDQYAAGQWYAALQALSYGTASYTTTQLAREVHSSLMADTDLDNPVEYTEDDYERFLARYRKAREQLHHCGTLCATIVDSICLYKEMPPWVERTSKDSPTRFHRELMVGLDAIYSVRTNRPKRA